MSLIRFSLLIILVCTLFQCGPEQQPTIASKKMNLKGESLHLLLFRKEMKLELWLANDSVKQRLSTLPLQSPLLYPLGVYDLHFSDGKWLPNFDRNKAQRKQTLLNDVPFPKKQTDLLSLLAAEDADLLDQQLKLAQNAQVLIFPNDSRSGKPFEGSRNGEPWLPELYSSLELWLRGFHHKEETKN
ncbi:MAG: hypothetical protein ACI8YQ_000834 [Polaribacter sp.]|jgi:hypothetical protein